MSESHEAPLEVPAPADPWQQVAAALRQSRGEWRRVTGHPAKGVATTNITRGVLAAFRPAGEYEAMRRDGELYVRWLGTSAYLAAAVGKLERGIG
jgi:hypothetical protein